MLPMKGVRVQPAQGRSRRLLGQKKKKRKEKKERVHSGKRKWQPIPVFLPGKVHGQRSLVGCSPWDYMTEPACMRRVEGDGLVAINW